MKKVIVYCLVLLIMMAHPGCMIVANENSTIDSTETTGKYTQILSGEVPADLQLTIYYMSPDISTRYPVDIERIVSIPATKKIIVDAEEIETNEEQLFRLATTERIPAHQKTYLDARLYYVLETESSGKILEVAMNNIYGDTFVNGIAIEDNLIFSEFIEPFLTQEAYAEMKVEELKARYKP